MSMEMKLKLLKKTRIFSQNTPLRSALHDETKNIFELKKKILVHH